MNYIVDSDKLDQHFLIDKDIISTVLKTSNLNKNDIVLVIGPGKGKITSLIAPKVKKVICIELDKRLKPFLDELKNKSSNIDIVYGDVLNLEIPKCNKIMTSLPFSILEPFIYKFKDVSFDEIIMIIGSRYANSVLNHEISNLSVLTNCYFKCEKVMDVLPESFYPKPRVLTSLIKLKHYNPTGIYLLFKNMYELDHKKIKNCIIESLIKTNYVSTKNEARLLLNKMNISDDILNKKFEICGNSELKLIFKKIEDEI